MEMTELPVLLPHELLDVLVTPADVSSLAELPASLEDRKRDLCNQLGLDHTTFIALGLHGDGVPHQKRKTIEVFSWNFVAHPHGQRYLFAALEKDFCCDCGCGGRHSLEALMEIFAWSMRQLMAGRWPLARHDKTPFGKGDEQRQAKQGTPFVARAGLFQLRGDWAYYKQLFAFPSWSSHSICWLCGANTTDAPYWDFSSQAQWRKRRYSKGQFWETLKQNGGTVCCLFHLPGVSLDSVMIDVLHALDLGVTQHALGNILWEYLVRPGFIPGRTQADRCKSLWGKLKVHYGILKTPNRIQALTLEMISRQGRAPNCAPRGQIPDPWSPLPWSVPWTCTPRSPTTTPRPSSTASPA